MQTRYNQSSSSSPSAISAQLAAIATKIDDIVSQLRSDVAELKTEMFGSPLKCGNQDLAKEEISVDCPSDDEDQSKRVLRLQFKIDDCVKLKIGDDVQLKIGDGQSMIEDLDQHNRSKENWPEKPTGVDSEFQIPISKESFEVVQEIGVEKKLFEDKTTSFATGCGKSSVHLGFPSSKLTEQAKGYGISMVFLPKGSHTHFSLVRQLPTTPVALPIIIYGEFHLQPHSVLARRWVNETGQPAFEWMIAWHNNYMMIFDLRTSRLYGWDVLIRSRY